MTHHLDVDRRRSDLKDDGPQPQAEAAHGLVAVAHQGQRRSPRRRSAVRQGARRKRASEGPRVVDVNARASLQGGARARGIVVCCARERARAIGRSITGHVLGGRDVGAWRRRVVAGIRVGEVVVAAAGARRFAGRRHRSFASASRPVIAAGGDCPAPLPAPGVGHAKHRPCREEGRQHPGHDGQGGEQGAERLARTKGHRGR